jgi:hypothetical protein
LVAAEPVDVRYTEGSLHGFLALHAADGKVAADGDAIQSVRGDQVTTHLVFHFRDGSLQDETTVYSQRRQFQLVSYRLAQKGPTFPRPLEMSVDGRTGKVSVRYTNEQGEQKVESEHVDVPPDLANGMIFTLLKNVRADALPKSVSVIAATPKPRLVKLMITSAGQEPFSIAGSRRQATHYVLKVELGGIAGVLAPVVGKKPPDSHVWIFPREVPAFVKAEQPFYSGSPLWRIELAGPAWPPTPPMRAEERTSLASPPPPPRR